MTEEVPGPEATPDDPWASHNSRVMANRRKYEPLVAAITDEQARMVIKLGRDEGQSMNRIAVLMRPHLDWEIPDAVDIMIGTDLYVTALKRFDLYDPDFRPFPERVPICTIDGVSIHYTTDRHVVDFEIDGVRHEFKPLHTVKYGIDASDVGELTEAIAIARNASPTPP